MWWSVHAQKLILTHRINPLKHITEKKIHSTILMWILWRKASLARTAYNENEIIKRNSRKLYLNRKKDIHKNHKMRWTKTYITCEAYYYTTFPNSSHTHKANKGRKSCFHMLYRKNRAMRNSKFNAWFKNEILFYCVTTTKP